MWIGENRPRRFGEWRSDGHYRRRQGCDTPSGRRAAELNASYAIASADAFAVVTALEFQARLMTGNPELKPLECENDLDVLWLPQRSR